MSEKYQKIQALIQSLEEYETYHPKASLKNFGHWLTSRENGQNEEMHGMLSDETSHHVEFYKNMPPARQFLILLSRAARFIDFYMKKAFEGLPLNSRLEFQFLISIKEMENPRKTDIIHFNLVEISTGVETLKRLKANGLVNDVPDTGDKRIKRLVLTKKGKAVLSRALEKFDALDKLANTFQTKDWTSYIPSLLAFNNYHNEIYFQHKEKPFEELSKFFQGPPLYNGTKPVTKKIE